ncbi:fibrillin-1-like [Contarinia nasturtii]|uniref:fibrillin-1-like n=1 Tax=Contarinia nasturtii TaxID=265458 RepID=UPI0012D39118|nr:fibrillin-1-like [Contarinia nasturtii]
MWTFLITLTLCAGLGQAAPSSQPDECKTLLRVPNADSRSKNGVQKITFTCREDYELENGQKTLQAHCSDERKWVWDSDSSIKKFCKPICSLPCENGGTCISPNKCACEVGYTGEQCENSIINCDFPVLENTKFSAVNDGLGVNATVECDKGYTFEDKSTEKNIFCTSDQWFSSETGEPVDDIIENGCN